MRAQTFFMFSESRSYSSKTSCSSGVSSGGEASVSIADAISGSLTPSVGVARMLFRRQETLSSSSGWLSSDASVSRLAIYPATLRSAWRLVFPSN